jgi:hypothetical protein
MSVRLFKLEDLDGLLFQSPMEPKAREQRFDTQQHNSEGETVFVMMHFSLRRLVRHNWFQLGVLARLDTTFFRLQGRMGKQPKPAYPPAPAVTAPSNVQKDKPSMRPHKVPPALEIPLTEGDVAYAVGPGVQVTGDNQNLGEHMLSSHTREPEWQATCCQCATLPVTRILSKVTCLHNSPFAP